ncbi:MAG: hypothetical protein GTN97_08800 [Nitrosopumilaceae archaeon]|nr:hypothetical protein [Nitrosopumilaceae archaeon]NIP10608.1 hypothetical protein [Nitrosopumilaceae archaeon]NIS95978.1 hypothetical protein [Nitrosopumilaceae archaeon]
MSSNYYRRGRNPTTAFGVLIIVIGAIALFRQLFAWSPDFFLQFLFNEEINSEKVSVITICAGIVILGLGFRKNEQKR